jgi:hypothetical protein
MALQAVNGHRWSLDHLVGAAEQRERNGGTEHLRGLGSLHRPCRCQQSVCLF